MTSGQLVADGYINKQHRNEPAKEYDEQFSENQSRLMRLKRISLWRAVISPLSLLYPFPLNPTPTIHYGPELPDFSVWIIHFPTSSGVEEWANVWAQPSVQAKQAMRSNQMNEWCERTSERTSEWPSTLVTICGSSVYTVPSSPPFPIPPTFVPKLNFRVWLLIQISLGIDGYPNQHQGQP